MGVTSTLTPKRNISAAIALIFVAPLVAEYLLGDLPLKLLGALILLAPMYGGGALLIREIVRQKGRGWPTMLLLGAAYALLEEGFTTQSLFNHDYLKMHMHLLDPAYIPALGIGAWWTLLMLNVHTFWSIGVSIALVEGLVPQDRTTPWLGRIGDSIVAVVFVLGMVANAAFQLKQDSFRASHAQFLSVGLIAIVLIVAAFLLPRRDGRPKIGFVPNPWAIGTVALIMGLAIMQTPPTWGWRACAVLSVLDAAFLILVGKLSQRNGWKPIHTLSLAGGGAIAYGVHAFLQKPLIPGSVMMVRVGNAIFLAAAIAVIVVGASRSARASDLTASPEGGTLNT